MQQNSFSILDKFNNAQYNRTIKEQGCSERYMNNHALFCFCMVF